MNIGGEHVARAVAFELGFAAAPMSTVTFWWLSDFVSAFSAGASASVSTIDGSVRAVRTRSIRTESPFWMPRPSTGS